MYNNTHKHLPLEPVSGNGHHCLFLYFLKTLLNIANFFKETGQKIQKGLGKRRKEKKTY